MELTALHNVSKWSNRSFWLASSFRRVNHNVKLGDSMNFLQNYQPFRIKYKIIDK